MQILFRPEDARFWRLPEGRFSPARW